VEVTLRAAGPDDAGFLGDMLVEAVCWRPGAARLDRSTLLDTPELGHYVLGWPRPGDRGVIAETPDRDPSGGPGRPTPVGAAWYRVFDPADPGFGFVSAGVPEVSIGVVADWRGRGVGRRLLSALLAAAAADGVPALCLSVEHDNPARHLYLSLGFRMVANDAGACTMVRTTAPAEEVSPPQGAAE
jgi:ribosomal protein S18 acetylase RimI-like enzyme